MSPFRPEGPLRRPTREQIEDQLLAELKRREAEFHNASPQEKEAAGERYREALERFNDLIVDRKLPPGTATEP